MILNHLGFIIFSIIVDFPFTSVIMIDTKDFYLIHLINIFLLNYRKYLIEYWDLIILIMFFVIQSFSIIIYQNRVFIDLKYYYGIFSNIDLVHIFFLVHH